MIAVRAPSSFLLFVGRNNDSLVLVKYIVLAGDMQPETTILQGGYIIVTLHTDS